MKKILFSSAFAFLSVAAMAQSTVSVGVRAGVTNSSVKGDAAESIQNLINYTGGAVSTQNKNGFYAGGFVSIPLSEQFSIEPGITYAQKGYTMRGQFGIEGTELVSAKSELTLGYIELPVLAKANISGLQLFAGPQVSYLASADLDTKAGALGFNFIKDKRDVKSRFNDLDVSLTGGVGYQFTNGLRLEASYDHGLSRINSGQSLEAYNRAFKVGVGFKF
ncbi:MAG: PorT family protein [Bacteroidota bacterium]|nr:PorT family protein [Bacteroidota bacterium]